MSEHGDNQLPAWDRSDYEAGWTAGYRAGFIKGQVTPVDDPWTNSVAVCGKMARLPEAPK